MKNFGAVRTVKIKAARPVENICTNIAMIDIRLCSCKKHGGNSEDEKNNDEKPGSFFHDGDLSGVVIRILCLPSGRDPKRNV
jgi:hypothetical protein